MKNSVRHSVLLEEWEKRIRALSRRRSGLALALWGEAGIGKTYTLRKLLEGLSCQALIVSGSLEPVQILRKIPHPRHLPKWADLAIEKAARGEGIAPALAQQSLVAILSELAPMVLVLEDIHECRPEQLQWVEGLANLVKRGKGIGLLASSRTQPASLFEAKHLQALDRTQTQSLLEAQLGHPLPPQASDWIFARAAGNPLFSLEYLRFLARQGFAWNDGEQWRWRTPPENTLPLNIEVLIEQQLSSNLLDSTGRSALEARAILGSLGNDLTLWQNLAELSEAAFRQAQQQLQDAGIVVGNAFSHPLIAEVARKTIPSETKQKLARKALEYLSPLDGANFVEMARLDPAHALDIYKQATEAASEAKQKATFLQKACQYAKGVEQAQLAFQAAQLMQGYDLEQALTLGKIALNLPENAEALRLVGLLLARKGDLAALEQFLAEHNSTLTIDELRSYAYHMAAQFPKVVELWQNSPQLKNTRDPRLLYSVTLAHLATRQNTVFQELLQFALSLPLTPLQRQDFLGIQAIFHSDNGHYKEAIEGFEATIQSLRDANERYKLGGMLHNLSLAYRGVLEYSKAQQALQESLEIRSSTGDMRPYSNSLSILAEIQAELGHQSQAEQSIEEALGLIQLQGVSQSYVIILSQACYVFSYSQSPIAAHLQLKYANQGVSLARQLSDTFKVFELLYDVALAQIRVGKPELGLEAIVEMLELAPKVDDPPLYQWRYRFAQGLAYEALGQIEKARTLLSEALELAQAIPDRLNAHKIGLELDRLNKNTASAAQRLQWFEGLGFGAMINRIKAYFPALEPSTRPESKLQSSQPRLEVLGTIQLDGQTLRGQKRKELLLALLEARMSGQKELSSLELLETLYPEENESEAQTALKQLVFKLRGNYGAGIIQTTHNGYALGDFQTDAEVFLQGGDVELWRGVYAEGLQRPSTVQETLYAGLKQAIRELENPAQTQRLSRLVLQADPYDLEALKLLCQSLDSSPKSQKLEYQQARVRLLEVGEQLPQEVTAFLKR